MKKSIILMFIVLIVLMFSSVCYCENDVQVNSDTSVNIIANVDSSIDSSVSIIDIYNVIYTQNFILVVMLLFVFLTFILRFRR